jgi:GNAT superfamily N-acetyltransferase
MNLTKHTELRPVSKLVSQDSKNPILTVRVATIADVALIRRLIAELADYEKEPDQVRTTEADIARDGFGANPQFRVLIGEWRGEPVGFAVFFHYYSTWRGAGLYLEDLFVSPEFRGRGIGSALLAHVARTAEQEGRVFIRWAVLNWNQRAIDMYKSLGAHFLDDWRIVLLAGEGLRKLAE